MFHVEHTRNGNSKFIIQNYKSQYVPRGTLAQIETKKKRVKQKFTLFSILI